MFLARIATFTAIAGLALGLASQASRVSAQQPNTALDIESLLPADGSVVEVLELRPPVRMIQLTNKMKEALAKDPEWLQKHIKANAKPGQPIPWDPKFGLTKEEYQEYLGIGNKIVLEKTKTLKVQVKRAEQQVELIFGDELVGLQQVTIDLKNDSVKTPYGTATERSKIDASEDQKVTGPWSGFQWKFLKTEKNLAHLTDIRIALGKMQKDGRGILYYYAKKLDDKGQVQLSYVLQYDLPSAKKD